MFGRPWGQRHHHGKFGRAFGFGEQATHGGGPWGFRRRFFESGEVRIALLALIAEGPKHGYELMKELEARSGGTYKASAGTVYPNLQLLEDEGLIRSVTQEDGKRVFTITAEGRTEIERQKEAIARVWSRSSQWGDWSDAMSPGAFEVMGPGMRLVRAAFTAAAHGDSAKIERVRQLLSKTADEIEKL